jgi:multicomponent Na+:H+ antiporter subunit C
MMEIVLALFIGLLFAAGLYCLLRRSLVKLVFGLILLSQGANLLVFTAGGLLAGRPPLIAKGSIIPEAPVADPLPQAMVLTAIVIGFGLVAFFVALVHRAHEAVGTDDINSFDQTDT